MFYLVSDHYQFFWFVFFNVIRNCDRVKWLSQALAILYSVYEEEARVHTAQKMNFFKLLGRAVP